MIPPVARALILTVVALTAGCGALPPLVASDEGVGSLLAYGLELRDLPPGERERHLTEAERAHAAHDTPVTRARLALALTAGNPRVAQLREASELVTPIAEGRTGAPPGQVALARWLLTEWTRDARQRAQLGELATLRERNATLESQLKAIRSIEEQLERRDAPSPRAAP